MTERKETPLPPAPDQASDAQQSQQLDARQILTDARASRCTSTGLGTTHRTGVRSSRSGRENGNRWVPGKLREMQGGGSAPTFNASQVAKDQQGSNIATATAQQILAQTNQRGPQGSLTYNQIGSTDVGGVAVPRFEAVQELSPEQLAIYNKGTGIQNQALDIAPGLLRNVNDAISKPLDFSGAPAMASDGAALRDKAYEALMSRSRQEIDRTRAAGETQAANQGIAPGSEAWKRQTQGFDQALVDASNQATINAGNIAGQDLSQSQALRNQWLNETLTQRNQPIQDIAALLGIGGGVSQPNFVSTPQTQIPTTDVTGPAMAQYQGELNAYNQRQSASNAMLGGLIGLGGSILGGALAGPLGAGLFGGLGNTIARTGRTVTYG